MLRIRVLLRRSRGRDPEENVLRSGEVVEARECLKNMISDISHQLKTPLAALDMYREILSEEPENEETVKTFSESMQSLERMEQLIQSLLKMARLDTGNIVSEKRQCFVAEVAEQAVSELLERARQEEKRILISWKSFYII